MIVKNSWLRRQYDFIIKYADSSYALWILCAISFAESSFFPLPPDLLLIPMLIANPNKAWFLGTICTITSVVGGFLGYAIGFYLYMSIGEWIIKTYNLQEAFMRFNQGFNNWGFWIIALKGLTPVPYKLVTIASGLAKFDLMQFSLASLIARGSRFFMLCGLLKYFGPTAKKWIEEYLGVFLLLTLATIVLGFVIFKYI